MMKNAHCRLCDGQLSEPQLRFPNTPLANEFVKTDAPQDLFPLEVCACSICGHYQLSVTVEPERLFRHYLFVAGTSPVNVEHFGNYAKEVVSRFATTTGVNPGALVVDVASNDGTLLRHFKNLGMKVLGIDPAVNLAEQATQSGIETIPEFFTESIAGDITSKHGKASVITANNVFAHTSDLAGFARSVKKLLAPNGVFIFEVSYFLDVCEKTLFDTIYHEHTSYHTVTPLVSFFKRFGLELFDVQKIDTHGGSIRCFVKFADNKALSVSDRLLAMLTAEKDIDAKVKTLGLNIERLRFNLRKRLAEIKSEGKSIAIFGMPAKATTLMYTFDLGRELIDFAIEDAPLKQGLLTPGKHIPVYSSKAIEECKPDCLLILAWNFADSIIKKHPEFKGKWITPIPELKEVSL